MKSLNQVTKYLKTKRSLFLAGILLGVFGILAIRFVTFSLPEPVHYHANFSLYINGDRETFDDPKYYEEVAICSADESGNLPQQRGHLHEDINDAIHVHDGAFTWGQFFNNLGWAVGKDYIQTDANTIYREDAANKFSIYINEEDYTGLTSLTNTVIQDTDRLLISFGNDDQAALLTQAKAVSKSADDYNSKPDPASCAGDKETTIRDRFENLL